MAITESQSRRYGTIGFAVILGTLAVWCFTQNAKGFDGKLEGTPPWIAGVVVGFFAVAALMYFIKESRASSKP